VQSLQLFHQSSLLICWFVEVEKINRQEIVHSQPLPSEFLRDRKPYSHCPMVESEQQPQKQQEQQQQPQQIPKVSRPPKHYQRDSNYRVDNIPESLWDETLTVAAQTYLIFIISTISYAFDISVYLLFFFFPDIMQQKLPLETWPTLSFLYDYYS
jgi:hypothetical protein